MAQRWVIKVFVERTGQSLRQAYVDFLRQQFGDPRTVSGFKKSIARRTSRNFDNRIDGREPTYGEHTGSCDDRLKKMRLITCRESQIISLTSKGYKMKEIANFMCLSQGRVNQMKKEIKEKMRIPDMSKVFEVNWITL